MIDISADAKSVRLDIYVEDGRKFKAALNVYSELNINMDMVFSEVEKHYMTPSITDKEKAEKAAWYISTVSDYEIYNSRLDVYKFKIEKGNVPNVLYWSIP